MHFCHLCASECFHTVIFMIYPKTSIEISAKLDIALFFSTLWVCYSCIYKHTNTVHTLSLLVWMYLAGLQDRTAVTPSIPPLHILSETLSDYPDETKHTYYVLMYLAITSHSFILSNQKMIWSTSSYRSFYSFRFLSFAHETSLYLHITTYHAMTLTIKVPWVVIPRFV